MSDVKRFIWLTFDEVLILSLAALSSILMLFDIEWSQLLIIPFMTYFLGYVTIQIVASYREIPTAPRWLINMCSSIVLSSLLEALMYLFGLNDSILPFQIVILLLTGALTLTVHVRRGKDSRVGNAFLVLIRSKMRGNSKQVAAIMMFAILLLSTGLIQAIPTTEANYTEFYLLNSEGNASNYSTNITMGSDLNVIVGLKNHEHRTVNYTIQYYLTNIELNSNGSYNATPIYYLGEFSVVSGSLETERLGNWSSQYQKDLSIKMDRVGSYKIWFIMFKDAVPENATGLFPNMDYFGTQVEPFIVDSILNPINPSLNLNVIIIPGV